MSTLWCLNPNSRSGQIDARTVADWLAPLGEVVVCELGPDNTIEQAVDEAGAGLERVVVGGGDGTVNAALAAVKAAGVPLGVIPLGTANDFARSLNLPNDPDAAAAVIVEGHTRKVGLGCANGHYFINAAGIGVGPELTKAMGQEEKQELGVLAYPYSLLKVMRREYRHAAIMRLDGKRKGVRFMQITIANGRHYGGGLTVAEDAELDDGLFRVLCLKPQSLTRLLGKISALRWGVPEKEAEQPREGMYVFTAKEVEVQTRRPVDVTLDGELLTSTPLRCTVEVDALEVYARRREPEPDEER